MIGNGAQVLLRHRTLALSNLVLKRFVATTQWRSLVAARNASHGTSMHDSVVVAPTLQACVVLHHPLLHVHVDVTKEFKDPNECTWFKDFRWIAAGGLVVVAFRLGSLRKLQKTLICFARSRQHKQDPHTNSAG